MRLSSSFLVSTACLLTIAPTRFTQAANECPFRAKLPLNEDDFNEPDWEQIIEIAFPTWPKPPSGCPKLDKIDGELTRGSVDPFDISPQKGKFNPCYYTKAFNGLDPMLGGYPTPIDTHYPFEFAAPFLKQPGDGSTHHCPINSKDDTKIQSCPKINSPCANGEKDCVEVTDKYGIGHIPPFVALAALKDEYMSCNADTRDFCSEWFDYDTDKCNIKPSVWTKLVHAYFSSDEQTIKFDPPILIDERPSRTYYKLEYIGEPDEFVDNVCNEGTCRGPHYCSKKVADEDIWGDFCPYVHTGPNSGQYRHPHIALAALELWFANQCMPSLCPKEWLQSPNAEGYGKTETSTSITWAEMEDNKNPMSQPQVPYQWPNSNDGIFPGHDELYGDSDLKSVNGFYVLEKVFEITTTYRDLAGPIEREPCNLPETDEKSKDELIGLQLDLDLFEPPDDDDAPDDPDRERLIELNVFKKGGN